MSTRTNQRLVQNPRLRFKISFFQDVFTIIEELTGDCPGVGLPEGFYIKKDYYKLFRKLQKKYNLTKVFITNLTKVESYPEWSEIKKIINLYRSYWKKRKNKLFNIRNDVASSINFNEFLNKLQRVTSYRWNTRELDIFLTLGYKNSGTYDREIDVIRIGIHEDKPHYLIYTLYHELIHFHIVKHMKQKLDEVKEEVLCRSIFKLLFNNNQIAQQHWKKYLTKEEIKKINKKAKELQFSL